MTIYDIKELTAQTAPKFFTSEALAYFGQTMRSFSVTKQDDGRYLISAPSYWNWRGEWRLMGITKRYFNPTNNQLEME